MKTDTTKRNLGYSLAEWERARQVFGEQQLAVDLLGEATVLGWLKFARRSLQLRGRREQTMSSKTTTNETPIKR